MADASLHLSGQNFRQFLADHPDDLLLVDFYADWCPHCQVVGPLLESLARKYKPQHVHIVKIDTDAYEDIAREYEIEVLPTLIVMRGGKQLQRETGSRPLEVLEKMITDHLTVTA